MSDKISSSVEPLLVLYNAPSALIVKSPINVTKSDPKTVVFLYPKLNLELAVGSLGENTECTLGIRSLPIKYEKLISLPTSDV